MHLLHVNNTDFPNFPVASPGVTKNPIIVLFWRCYFYETMYRYQISIMPTSNHHHDCKEVAISPEQSQFLTRAVRVTALFKTLFSNKDSFSVSDNTLVLDNLLCFSQSLRNNI